MSRKAFGFLAAMATLLAAPLAHAQLGIDPKLRDYQPVNGVSGTIKSIGSDTMNNLMTLWAEGFKKFYPSVQVEVEGKGSATAPAALIAGTAQFGPMSRPMKEKEIDDFEKKFGYKPIGVPTSLDVLAVFVHKDNPIRQLSLDQVDAVFSKTRKRGFSKNVVTWGDLGLQGEWADKPVSCYGRNSASGTYGYFKEHVLSNGDFKDSVKEQPGTSSVVQGVANDMYAIGYGGIGYKTADVRAVPLSAKAGGKVVEAEAQYALDGTYPLARLLFVYVNHKPGSELDPLRGEFIRFVVSKYGQEIVVKDGYVPLPARLADQALKSVNLLK